MAAKKNDNQENKTTETETGDVETIAENEPVLKSGFKKVVFPGFTGTYKDAYFDDNGVCAEISKDTLELLSKQYKDAEIEEVK